MAPVLIARLNWHGRVLTGDALSCQRPLCQQVLDAGGDDLIAVKQNQQTLARDLQLLFDPPAGLAPRPPTDERHAETLDDGHGRTLERRRLTASTDLVGIWTGERQALRIARTWREQETTNRAVRSAITSLSPVQATPAHLLACKRGHWAIENQLHRCKDVNLGEDASLIHVGQGPQVMAVLRDTAVSLLHRAEVRQIAARLRRHRQHPDQAVALVVGPLPTGA